MDKLQKAWLSGFVDGEGCLTISKYTKKRKGKIYVYYRPVVVISNTSMKLLEFIRDMLGYGRIYDRVHIFPNAKLQHALRIYRINEILQFCKELYPYLLAKSKQAKILIQACQSTADRKELYEKVHALNKKGED